MHTPRSRRSGFTLQELLVVLAILALLIAFLFPAIQRSREAAVRTQCQNNLKQLALACHAYHTANGTLPPGGVTLGNVYTGDKGSWLFYLAPYFEQQAAYETVTQLDVPDYDSTWNSPIRFVKLSFLLCPADGYSPPLFPPDVSYSNYVGSLGPQQGRPYHYPEPPYPSCAEPWTALYANRADLGYPPVPGSDVYGGPEVAQVRGLFSSRYGTRIRFADVPDGLSNTFMLGETISGEDAYMRFKYRGWAGGGGDLSHISITIIPMNTRTPDGPYMDGCHGPNGDVVMGNWGWSIGFKSLHPNGANFAFADGSIRFVSQNINMDTYQLLGCRNDDHVIDSAEY
jgi:prepilin-type N-terminal cleavage/methylation domain-containing protein/prepilin-type processing-associated H-X9-DG protein